eukprot:5070333-Pyramimonas_sp.AAC.1
MREAASRVAALESRLRSSASSAPAGPVFSGCLLQGAATVQAQHFGQRLFEGGGDQDDDVNVAIDGADG